MVQKPSVISSKAGFLVGECRLISARQVGNLRLKGGSIQFGYYDQAKICSHEMHPSIDKR